LLNKVVTSLEKADFSKSNAMAHALVIRADAYLDFNVNNPNEALKDAIRATEINHLDGRAYRVKADAYEAMGDVLGAMQAIEKWAEVNPAFMAKAKNELSRLSKCNP
jgi:tetratricopeptide (TPR) repeat protein